MVFSLRGEIQFRFPKYLLLALSLKEGMTIKVQHLTGESSVGSYGPE